MAIINWEKVSESELESLMDKNLIDSSDLLRDALKKGEYNLEEHPIYKAEVKHFESSEEPFACFTIETGGLPKLRYQSHMLGTVFIRRVDSSRDYERQCKLNFDRWFRVFLEMSMTLDEFLETLNTLPADDHEKEQYISYFRNIMERAIPHKTLEVYLTNPQEFFRADKPRFESRVYLKQGFNPDSIRELRKREGLSQTKLAKILRVTPNTLRNWEHGRSTPSGARYDLVQQFAKEKGHTDIEFYKR